MLKALAILLLGILISTAVTLPVAGQVTAATTVIAHLAPGTTRNELQQTLPGGSRITGWLPQISAAVLTLPHAAMAGLDHLPKVRRVEQDAPVHPLGSGADPLVPLQYGLAKVQAQAAWNLSTGQGRVIAVVDTGIQLDHPDLATQLWANAGEIPGNGIDDEHDGYVDDVHGWHFYHAGDCTSAPQANGDISDGLGHGTHVAGIAAAARNNGEGGSGVAPGARLMIVRVFGRPDAPADTNGCESDIALALLFAVDHGANVINLSLGGDIDVQVMHDAVNYALARGVVVVAAAGNGGSGSSVLYPARYGGVMAVAATDANDQVAFFSSGGPELSMSAPGVSILSTSKNPAPSDECGGTLMPPSLGYYGYCNGTSMATPFVSGAAALVGSLHPTYTPACIRIALEHSADDIGAPGYDQQTGWGRLNAARALQLAAAGGCYTDRFPLVLLAAPAS